jgi:uncharacterized surface protein with fasciclin (FAS1) repeats
MKTRNTLSISVVVLALSMSAATAADIVETAIANGSFNTFVTAVKAAGLDDTLRGTGPFTIFAPTDEAFANLPEGVWDNLLKPENQGELTAILNYHVVSGKLMSTDLSDKTTADRVAGGQLWLDATEGVHVDNAKVLKADIEASNGVIHVIDSVMMPKD